MFYMGNFSLEVVSTQRKIDVKRRINMEFKRISPEANHYLSCEDSSISNVQKATEKKLKDLLSGNRI